MSELFISYGRKNRDIVEPIVTLLKELGVVAWMDSGIQAGERYRREIRSQLKDAKAVLVCWSPEALDSDWVDYEADIALEYGTYVPVLLAPCALQPPFSSFQTPDLSKWNGQPTHPDWLMLIDKIAEKVDRKGITEAARAMASNDDQTRYNFSKNYPDEPLARKLWLTYEARHREEFNQLLAAARDRVRTRINHQYVDLDARLAGAVPALEAWLAEERRGTAKEPRPDPSAIIDGRDVADEAELRSEIASLSGNLSRAKSREDQLNEELRRLSQSLVEAAEETKRFREEGVSLQQELRAAKSETERISLELQSVTLNKEKLVNQNARAAADLQARTELEIAKNVAADEFASHKQELDAANALITRLSAQLESKISPTNAYERRPADETNSARKESRGAGHKEPTRSKTRSGIICKIGATASFCLVILYTILANSGSYIDRENSKAVLGGLFLVVLFSVFAYFLSRPRKATINSSPS